MLITILFILLAISITFLMLYLLTTTEKAHPHMSYDEEVEWLMKDHKLTKEEAEEIANLPW